MSDERWCLVKKMLILFLIFFGFFSSHAETFILKNGTLITGEIKKYSPTKKFYTVNIPGKDTMVEDIIDIKREDIEAILIKQVISGAQGKEFRNFKYQFYIKKPTEDWFFIENPIDNKPILTIAQKTDIDDSTPKVRVFVFGPYPELTEEMLDDQNELTKFARDFFIKNFRMYIGYEDGIEYINNRMFFWRIANNFVFDSSQREVKMKYKQFLCMNAKHIFVIDYCHDEKRFSRETGLLDEIVRSFEFQTDENIYLQISNMFFYKGHYKKALDYIKKAIELQPHRGDLYQKMGDIYGRLGLMKDAFKAFKDSLRHGADSTLIEFELDNLDEEFYNGVN